MRFVHTADWQIGMRAAHVGGAGPRVREERLAAAAAPSVEELSEPRILSRIVAEIEGAAS